MAADILLYQTNLVPQAKIVLHPESAARYRPAFQRAVWRYFQSTEPPLFQNWRACDVVAGADEENVQIGR